MAKANSQRFRGTFVLMISMTFWVLLVTVAAESEKYPNGTKGTDDTEQLVPVEDNGYKRFLQGVNGPFVYIIQMAGEPKLIKVGRTSQPLADRRRALNTGNPYRLEIVAAWQVKDMVLGEKAAHKFLDDGRRKNYVRAKPTYNGGKEWFIVKDGDLEEAYKGIEKALKTKNQFVMKVIK